jgi:hypothetical protein
MRFDHLTIFDRLMIFDDRWIAPNRERRSPAPPFWERVIKKSDSETANKGGQLAPLVPHDRNDDVTAYAPPREDFLLLEN